MVPLLSADGGLLGVHSDLVERHRLQIAVAARRLEADGQELLLHIGDGRVKAGSARLAPLKLIGGEVLHMCPPRIAKSNPVGRNRLRGEGKRQQDSDGCEAKMQLHQWSSGQNAGMTNGNAVSDEPRGEFV